jgi:uncharacterized protein
MSNVPSLTLILLPYKLAICRLSPNESIPAWAFSSTLFFSITKTPTELSVVIPEDNIPSVVTAQKGWCALMIEGQLDFSLTGILASLLVPLANAHISIFALSTYDTDYVLIKKENIQQALSLLNSSHTIKGSLPAV